MRRPRSARKASRAPGVAPVEPRVWRSVAARSSSRVLTMPSIRSEWPEMYFVALWTTTSAPSSSGRCSSGVAKVASTATAAPAAWAPSISRSSSATPISGLVGVSTHSSAAPSHSRSTASVSVMSASTSSTRPAAARSRSSIRTPV